MCLAKRFVRTLRVKNAAATKMQAVIRGRRARADVKELKLSLKRVVPTQWAFSQLRKHCQITRDTAAWQELKDMNTNQYFYYEKATGETQWAPPIEMYSSSARFCCTWQDCLGEFDTLKLLEKHRHDVHRWKCPACQTK